jgi:hypothetical protein
MRKVQFGRWQATSGAVGEFGCSAVTWSFALPAFGQCTREVTRAVEHG